MKDIKSELNLQLEPLKPPLTAVVEVLYEAVVMHNFDENDIQQDFVNSSDEREAQIIFHLRNNIGIEKHVKPAIDLVKKLHKADYFPD